MAPKTFDQNKKIKDERREQIMLSALKLFARRGPVATKISDIAEAAGVSQGLVYHYFESKEAIYTELVRQATEISGQALLQMEELPMEPLEKIGAIAEGTMKSIANQEEGAYYFLLMTQALVTETNPEPVRALVQQPSVPFEVMVKIVNEGQAKGVISACNAGDMVMVFWSAINGLALSKLAYGESFSMPDPRILVRIFSNSTKEV